MIYSVYKNKLLDIKQCFDAIAFFSFISTESIIYYWMFCYLIRMGKAR
jgi:hypothetical protein